MCAARIVSQEDSSSEIVDHGVLDEDPGGSWAVLGRFLAPSLKIEEIIKEVPQT